MVGFISSVYVSAVPGRILRRGGRWCPVRHGKHGRGWIFSAGRSSPAQLRQLPWPAVLWLRGCPGFGQFHIVLLLQDNFCLELKWIKNQADIQEVPPSIFPHLRNTHRMIGMDVVWILGTGDKISRKIYIAIPKNKICLPQHPIRQLSNCIIFA